MRVKFLVKIWHWRMESIFFKNLYYTNDFIDCSMGIIKAMFEE